MGRASRSKQDRARPVAVTHEPQVPENWPDGHVDVQLTDISEEECVIVTIHGVKHFLHSTTARALSDRLIVRIDEWNDVARAAGELPV